MNSSINNSQRPKSRSSQSLVPPPIPPGLSSLASYAYRQRRLRAYWVKTMKLLSVTLLLGVMNFAAALDINSASAEQIASGLKGVGLKKAQAIVDYRNANGKFKSRDDLLKVKGIGQKLLDLNPDNIAFTAEKSAKAQ